MEGVNKTEGSKLEILKTYADKYFSSVQPGILNSKLLTQIVSIPGLTTEVVKVLKREEENFHYPLQDDDLRSFIVSKCAEQSILLPSDELDLERWFSLIYMAASIVEEFSYGNLVRTEDITGEEEEDGNRELPSEFKGF